MNDYVQRMIKEQEELQVKISALRSFIMTNPIWNDLDSEDKRNMSDQEHYMAQYHRVLMRRIKRATRFSGEE